MKISHLRIICNEFVDCIKSHVFSSDKLYFQDASGAPSPTRAAAKQRALQKAKLQKQKLVSHSTAMESIQAQTEPIDEQEHLPYVLPLCIVY